MADTQMEDRRHPAATGSTPRVPTTYKPVATQKASAASAWKLVRRVALGDLGEKLLEGAT
jgi:hypothetical protein